MRISLSGTSEPLDLHVSARLAAEPKASVKNLDPDDVPLFIEVDRHTFIEIHGLGALRVSELDVQRVHLRVIGNPHRWLTSVLSALV
jgi:hypothetical protein